MNKIQVFLITFSFFLSGNALASEEPSKYRQYMHHIFESFNHSRISYTMKKHDISDLFLKHLAESIDGAVNNIPEKKKDGTLIDKKVFQERFGNLKKKVLELKGTLLTGGMEKADSLPQEIFNMCVTCHKDAKLEHLFKQTRYKTTYGEYMHEISEYVNLTKAYMEENRNSQDIEDNLKIINYYLSLLEETFPQAGPSGIVMDKGTFKNRLEEVKRFNEDMQKKVREKKKVNADALRKSLNSLCVTCHEPDRIK